MRWSQRRQRQRETDLRVPDLQVPMINEGRYYYYFTTTYRCSISFSSSSFQIINFAVTSIYFDLSEFIFKCVLLSHLLSEESGCPRAFLSYFLTSSIFFNVMRAVQEISSSSSLSILDYSKVRIYLMMYGIYALLVNLLTVIVWVSVTDFSRCWIWSNSLSEYLSVTHTDQYI